MLKKTDTNIGYVVEKILKRGEIMVESSVYEPILEIWREEEGRWNR